MCTVKSDGRVIAQDNIADGYCSQINVRKIFFEEMNLVSKTDIETIEKAVQKSGMACVEHFEVYYQALLRGFRGWIFPERKLFHRVRREGRPRK